MNTELKTKIERVKGMLAERQLDALLVQRVANFAWLTGGAISYVNTVEEAGVAYLLVTPDNLFLITNNIEAPRFQNEELLGQQGWEFVVAEWYQPVDPIEQLTKDLRLGTDGLYPRGENLHQELIRLRADLLPVEQERYRQLSQGCAQAMNAAIHSIQPAMTEFEIAARLSEETQKKGILPIVNLIATDERIFAYRHPLPTSKQLERYAMLVLCGLQKGLVAALTRLVYFGVLPDELQEKSMAVAEIDAAFISATRPGRPLAEIFTQMQAEYARTGYPDEWRLHHQGGPAGYAGREAIATPQIEWIVKQGQVFAWNPSITGTKSEDTILVKEGGNEILTGIAGWPEIMVSLGGQIIPRPAILELS